MSARGKVPTKASDLAFTPAGTIAATNVQTAIEEVAAEAAGDSDVGDASTDDKGIVKLSVAPASPTDPIAAGTNDPRLSDARTPTAHTHPQSDVTGLTSALAAKADLVGGVVPTAQIPAIATGQTVTVASQAAMLALTSAQVQPGDVAIRTDLSGHRFLLADPDPSVLAHWIALETPDAVSSVNSQQGTVVLGKADIGLGNVDNTSDANKPVSTAQQAAIDAEAAARVSGDANNPSAGQKAALAGTSGTPGSGNKYVTDADPRNSDTRTPSDASVTLAKWAAGVLDTDGGLGANSDGKIASQKAVKTYVDALLAAQDAFVFKGAIDASSNPNYPAASAGHVYRISVAGKIGGASGPNVEVGDQLWCIVDGSAAGTHAAVGANWVIGQVNIDGAVIGPASSTSANFATFSGSSGKLIQDSGVSLDTDNTFAANSDVRLPSQKAVKGYITTQTGLLIPKSLADAKGDTFVADGNDSVVRKAVGSDGQFFMADSSSGDGTSWANARVGRYRSGGYYMTAYPTNQVAAPTLGDEFAVPLLVDVAVTMDRVAISMLALAGAGGVARLGLRQDNGRGLPSTLITDFGTVITTSTGVKELTVSQALTPGLYWLTATAQVAAGNFRGTHNGGSPSEAIKMGPSTSLGGTEGDAMHGYKQTGQTGALGSTFTLNATVSSAPIIYMRFA